ncbi:YtxH domain-containing protein [Desulfovibrio sp. JC010]|uniref:YtxH domain-containing protein n=1 Tax=Desulfovibrio sp. JC010 TaxID=2593641 RepID=UPI0013D1DCAD|nr:YtxH domain-containing protein [Desulfovibrio sp. JC010]NDV26096.1 YtxH domain-containing protein [Desulfovibrio sp. JC010]
MSQDYNNDYVYNYQDPQLTDQQRVDTLQQVEPVQQDTSVKSWVNFTDSRYLKGFLVGAGVALVASNPKVQKAVVSGVVKSWSAVQGGIEEAKEKIHDIKAEAQSE